MTVRVGRLNPAVVITTGNPDTVVDSAPATTAVGAAYDLRGQLGSLYRSPDGMREWLYVQYSATSTGKATAANQIAFFLSSTTTTLDPTWVVANETSSNTADVSEPAGILRTTSTSLGGKYIWVLRKAPTCLVVSTTTILGVIKGSPVICTTVSGEAAVVASTTTGIATDIGSTPFFWSGGNGRKIGLINTTTTNYSGSGGIGSGAAVGLGVNLDVALDIS